MNSPHAHLTRRTTLKLSIAVLASVAVVSALASCSAGGPAASGTSSAHSGSSKTSASLTIDTSGYPASLDPGLQYDSNSYEVYRNIFDQLLSRNPTSHAITADIATSWKEITPTQWRFQIRPGVHFSNGQPLTAADVAYSITRILDPAFASPQSQNLSAISSAVGQGDTLTINTKFPSPTLLSYLTTLSVVPEAYVKKVGNTQFNLKPIGSGPYELESTSPGSQVVLGRNPHYWHGEPQVKTVTFRAVTNLASRVADLQSGKAQIVTALTSDSATQLKGSSAVRVLSTPTERVAQLKFNTLNGGPTNSLDVRKAISLAIDRTAIIKNLEGGFAASVNSPLTPLNLGYDPALPAYKFNPTRAKSLLKAAGAVGDTLVMPTSPSFEADVTQAIQQDLAAVGLKVSIVNSDQATYLKKVQSPQHNWGSLTFNNWSCSCLDADGVLYPQYLTGSVWTSFSNKTFDKLVTEARQTLDTAARKKDYAAALSILNDQVAAVGLFQYYALYGVSSNVQFTPDAQQDLFVADIHVTS